MASSSKARSIVATILGILSAIALVAVVPISATADTIARGSVTGDGPVVTTLTFDDGGTRNVVMTANWVNVTATTATLESVNIAVGNYAGDVIYGALGSQGGGPATDFGSKYVSIGTSATWLIGQTYSVYSGNVYTQIVFSYGTSLDPTIGGVTLTTQYER